MVNVNKLKGKIVECETTIEELAKEIGVDKSTLYRKIKDGGVNISIKEADLLAKALNLKQEEAIAIFFAQYVA